MHGFAETIGGFGIFLCLFGARSTGCCCGFNEGSKKNGFAFHVIGLHDHYSGFDNSISKVNFLKYSERVWSFFIYNNISYHNQLREKSFVDMFLKCGARIDLIEHKLDQEDIIALQKMKIDKKFHGFTDEELAIYQSKVILSFPENQ